MPDIHPTAIVEAGAALADGVRVGAWSTIGANVAIGAGTTIAEHVVIRGRTRIGAGNRIFQFNSIGDAPQDKKYAGEPTELVIGDGNTIREFCTLNTGTVQDQGVTRIGDRNWIMAYVHVAHDCVVGDDTVLANGVTLAGHVRVGDFTILGGFTAVHQHCRIGAHCMLGGGSIVLQDVPPYVMANGNSASPHGVNSEGLKRRGFTAEAIAAIRRAYKTLYKSGLLLEEAKAQLAAEAAAQIELLPLVEFLAAPGRGIIR
ncbi:MAG: acyl-ACP--UDP-N-acetylglucosamine O-acyltransferase [Betaproteobacteria bacterium]|nr:acyl-ACP--UDP-N-acetylglucosamine O-acyltransferase [Betaproteobacteria bacterium]